MKKQDRLEMLSSCIRSGVSPILMEGVTKDIFDNSVVLDAKCDRSLLNGYYEGAAFVPPKWYLKLLSLKSSYSILIIDKLDEIDSLEQKKFLEIIKYRKVSTFELPKNTIIIITANPNKKNLINEDIYSFVAHIED